LYIINGDENTEAIREKKAESLARPKSSIQSFFTLLLLLRDSNGSRSSSNLISLSLVPCKTVAASRPTPCVPTFATYQWREAYPDAEPLASPSSLFVLQIELKIYECFDGRV